MLKHEKQCIHVIDTVVTAVGVGGVVKIMDMCSFAVNFIMSVTAKRHRRRAVAAYPYHIYLGDTHVVEVKKGGLQIGIYLITATLRRRVFFYRSKRGQHYRIRPS